MHPDSTIPQTTERQMAITLDQVDLGHLHRYFYAMHWAKEPVLDAACGCGYGSSMLAQAGHAVTAVDIDRDTISFGSQYWGHENIHWIKGDITSRPWGWERFNTAVCLETLEHLREPEAALAVFHESLNPGGKLVVSVPNEEKYPFDPKVFAHETYPHQRHYTPAQLEELLYDNGFTVIHRGTQLGKRTPVVNGSGGVFLVYTAERRERVDPYLQTR